VRQKREAGASFFIRGSSIRENRENGRRREGGLWGEDGDREELCAYNKDELSVVVS
jgi:hypothetical protein